MFEKYLPDISEYLEAWRIVVELSAELQKVDGELEEIVANIYLECIRDNKYFLNGKAPAISLIKESYAVIGHTEDATEKLGQLKYNKIVLQRAISEAKAQIKAQEMKLNLYQTMSANARNVAGFTDE